MPESIGDEQLDNAGPDTLRRLLIRERQLTAKMKELLQLCGDAMRSANGNLVMADGKIKELFKEVVNKT